jgi:hypothetical protein
MFLGLQEAMKFFWSRSEISTLMKCPIFWDYYC